jgi:hypothetical protein
VAHGSGLPGAVVQRSLADWPVVLAAWLLLVSATTLLATGIIYGDAVASGGLHRDILAAPPASRTIDVALTSDQAGIDGLDSKIRPAIVASLAASGGEVVRVVRSGPFADPATPPDDVHDLTLLQSFDSIEAHATLVDGTWPHAGATPIEATLSEPAATAMNLKVGDRLPLISRLDTTLRIEVVVAGIWRVDPTDALWIGDPLETTGTTTGGSFTTRGPLVVREADVVSLGGGGARAQVEWRGLPNIDALRIDQVEDLRNATNNLPAVLRGVIPANTSPRVVTSIPALLDDVGRSVLVSRSGVILLTIQFAVLAGYAVVLVAGMLVERRRSEIALVRSRGASGAHLIAMAVMEATFLAIPAAILAPWLALGIVALLGTFGPTAGLGIASTAAITPSAILVAALAAVACIVALTLPTLFVSASPAGARAAQGRQARTTLPQRLGLDLALVAVAGVALWQLRLYGAPLTRNARGTLGLDPLLVAAPAIGLVGGAVLALRVVPRVAELGERLLVRGRGLVGSLGGRQLARRPLRYTRAALLLMLAAALGTLAAAHAATWTRSQADQAAYQAAADVRVLASDYTPLPTWAAGPLYRSIPGVEAATPIAVAPIDVGRTIRDGRLVGLDPANVGSVLGRGATPTNPAAADLVATLAAARRTLPTIAVPGDPHRLAVTLDAAFQSQTDVGPGVLSPDTDTLTLSAVLVDGDGRLFRTAPVTGSLTEKGQRLVISLVDPSADGAPAGIRPTSPLRLEGLELLLSVTDQIAYFGEAELVGIEASDAESGDAGWTTVPFDAGTPGWQWRRNDQGSTTAYTPSRDRPGRIAFTQGSPLFGGFGSSTTFRLQAELPRDTALPAIASASFLEKTGASVGETATVSSVGQPIRFQLLASTELFAPLDPAVPFLITDLSTLDAARFVETSRTQQADEWWLSVDPAQTPAVLQRLRESSAGAQAVIGRDELARSLTTDPVPLGLIGVLGLGSLAAMLFAGIGFLVSSTVSTSERIGEFALLRALGLSAGQLSLWLSIESVFLLVVGLVAGSILGLILAWLVLPFATLTQTGAAPIPAPVVVVPWEAIVPVYLAAVILFVLSIWLVRRQLPDIKISGVLRARES